jgi:hypothetical protein
VKIEQARVALYDALAAAVATLNPVPAIEWDNRFAVDMSQQTAPFLCVEFIVGAAVQKSLGMTKVVRYIGQLAVIVNIKEGQGIARVTVILDALCLALGMKNLSGLQTEAAMPQRPVLDKGWHIQPLVVPFWFDDVVVG